MNKKIIVCFVILIILLAAIIGVPRGENMKQEKIPQEVVEFFDSEYKQKIYFYGYWQNYRVYYVSFPELNKGVSGLPTFLLYKYNLVRVAEPDEIFSIMEKLN